MIGRVKAHDAMAIELSSDWSQKSNETQLCRASAPNQPIATLGRQKFGRPVLNAAQKLILTD
jgi:hypothetical protein